MTKFYFFIYTSLMVILLAYNNCSSGFESESYQEVKNEGTQIPDSGGVSPDGKNPKIIEPSPLGKVTCSQPLNSKLMLQGNIGTLTKQQYENSVMTILGLQIQSTFVPEFVDYKFRTTFDNRSSGLEYSHKIFENAKKIIDLLEQSNTVMKNKVYFCKTNERDCLKNFINKWGRLIYRRKLTSIETNKISLQAKKISAELKAVNNLWSNELKAALFTLFSSPQFIYQIYSENMSKGSFSEASEVELASKLSFFIWGSGPDNELLEVAESNQLKIRLEEQINRLLADERSIYISKELVQNWLNLGSINVQPKVYGMSNLSDLQIKNALVSQLNLFVHDLVRRDRPVLELMNSNKMFHNKVTQQIYSLKSKKFPNMSFSSGTNTLNQNNGTGVLGHIGFLSSVASGSDYSIFHRGPWLLENVLCEAIPGPASGVSLDGVEGEFNSLTAALKAHSNTESSCYSCHQFTDPLGAALENYDALGRYRTHYSLGHSLIQYDYITIDKFNISNPVDLVSYITTKKKKQFQQCLTTQVLSLATSKDHRNVQGECYAKNVNSSLANEKLTFKELIKGIISSSHFKMVSKGQ